MSNERVAFANGRGQTLVGVLHGRPAPTAVICCHGMLSDKDGAKHRMLASRLVDRDQYVLRFDFAGRGESEGHLYDMSYSSEVEDLQAAIDFLAARGIQRIGLFGSSMGGAVALLGAARDERIAAVATLAAVAHPALIRERHAREVADWEKHGYIDTDVGRIGKGFYLDALQHDVIAAVMVLQVPVLVLHGERDDVVPPSDGHDIATAARHSSLEIVLGADHRFSDPIHLRPAIDRVVRFFCKNLR